MFKGSRAFSSFSVNDIDKARIFYGDILGLDVFDVPGMEGLLQLRVAGGNPVLIYPKDDHVPASFTVLNFPVDDVEFTVDRLAASGIHFEKYDSEDIKTDAKGIHKEDEMSIAWFKDPDGNILSVMYAKPMVLEKEEALAEAGGAGA